MSKHYFGAKFKHLFTPLKSVMIIDWLFGIRWAVFMTRMSLQTKHCVDKRQWLYGMSGRLTLE